MTIVESINQTETQTTIKQNFVRRFISGFQSGFQKYRKGYLKWREKFIENPLYNRWVLSLAKVGAEHFIKLECIDSETKKRYLKGILYANWLFGASTVRGLMLFLLIYLPLAIFLLMISSLLTTISSLIFWNKAITIKLFIDRDSTVIGILFASILIIWILSGFGFVLRSFHYQRPRIFSAVLIYLVANISIYITIMAAIRNIEGTFVLWTLLSASILGMNFGILGWLATFIAYYSVEKIIEYNFSHDPQSALAFYLSGILTLLEGDSNPLVALSLRKVLLSKFENAAMVVEKGIPLMLWTDDPSSNKWVRGTCQEIASGLRSLKMWILSPLPDTNKYLIERVKNDLFLVLDGNWQNLERKTYVETPRQQKLGKRLMEILGSLIAPTIFTLIFIAIQSTSLALPSPLSDYGKVGLLIWYLLSIIIALDPLYKIKLDTAKDIRDLIFRGK